MKRGDLQEKKMQPSISEWEKSESSSLLVQWTVLEDTTVSNPQGTRACQLLSEFNPAERCTRQKCPFLLQKTRRHSREKE